MSGHPVADPVYDRLARFADMRAAGGLVFGWAAFEATWFFLVPEFLLYFLVLPRPWRALALATWATLGWVAGGLLAYTLSRTTGSLWVLDHALARYAPDAGEALS